MKQIVILLIPFILMAQSYTFSGPKANVAQATAGLILEKAYSRVNIPIKIISLSPEASLKASNSGEVDGELARIKKISELYPNLVQVPVVLIQVEAVAFSKDSHIKIKKWNDLKDYKFTVVKGTKFIEKGTRNLEKDLVDTFKQAFDKLNSNETEIIVIPKKAAIKMILQMKYSDIKPISPALQRLSLYHFVHKKNVHLIPIITPILQKMKDSGEMDYISSAYLRELTYQPTQEVL